MFLNLIISELSTQYLQLPTMFNRVGRVHKLGKYNRQRSIVKNRPLKITLPYYNSHDKYNEKINVVSKETITADAYSRPSNDKNDAFCLFLAYFIHFVVENNRISQPHSLIHFRILISNFFGGLYGTVWYRLKSILIMPLYNRKWGNRGKYTKLKWSLKLLVVLKPMCSLYIYIVKKQ